MPKSIESPRRAWGFVLPVHRIEAPESIESPRRIWGFVLPVHRTEAIEAQEELGASIYQYTGIEAPESIESPKRSLGLRFTCAMGAEARVNRKPKEKHGTSYYLWSAGQAKTQIEFLRYSLDLIFCLGLVDQEKWECLG